MKTVYKVVGLLSLGVGAVGVVLPLLPTTPFLLLAAFCFARSSERLHAYLYEHSFDLLFSCGPFLSRKSM